METATDKLRKHSSQAPSKWREEAEFRRDNKGWLKHSLRIAVKMLNRMEELNLSQKAVAELLGCSQQYVSRILKGRENLSLETISKIESALQLQLMPLDK